jgi:hypothetical protein
LAFENRVTHAALVLDSHLRVTGRSLMARGTVEEDARALYHAPFVVLTHATGPDPLFTYGNLAAQALFEVSPAQLLALRSRLSAEPANQAERQRLLEAVTARGYIDDYAGIRVSRSGRRFRIEAATVWNLVDEEGMVRGQAATFCRWQML